MWREWFERLGAVSNKTLLITALIAGVVGGLALFSYFGSQLPDDTAQNGKVEGEMSRYPVHRDIVATVFWVGESADSSNDYIHNKASYWTRDWVRAFGGVDDPRCREGYSPCGFTPKENPFYFALPYGERHDGKLRPASELKEIHWYEESVKDGTSLLKNRWVRIMHDGKAAYAQWQDVGPFETDDKDYVFGGARPAEPRAGIDLSPATAKYLGVDGRGTVDWQFVDSSEVPDGPWSETVTTKGSDY